MTDPSLASDYSEYECEPEKSTRSRENLHQFINHVEVLAIEEARHFQKKIRMESLHHHHHFHHLHQHQHQRQQQYSFFRPRPETAIHHTTKPYELKTSFSANHFNIKHMFESFKSMQEPKQSWQQSMKAGLLKMHNTRQL